jgi:hypothetical protein
MAVKAERQADISGGDDGASTPQLRRAHGFDQASTSSYPPFPGREADEHADESLERLKYSRSGL